MKNAIFTIMKKEIFRFFGDKRMALTTIFLPGILIYVIYTFMGDAITNSFMPDDEYKPSLSVINMPESVNALLEAANFDIEIRDGEDLDSIKQSITDSETDLCAVFPADFDSAVAQYDPSGGTAAPNIEIYYNSSNTEGQTAYGTLTALLDSYESTMTNKFDINNTSEKYDLADEKDITGMIYSTMLPMLLLIFMFSGCMAVAPESIAGEKERGTIATLLITPVKRSHIALGKIFALSVIAILSGASSTIGTVLSLPKLMGGTTDGMSADAYNPGDYAWLALVIFSTVLLLVTAVSIISAFAKTIKEAQGYVSPLMILTILVGVTGMFGGGIKHSIVYYLIPLYNSVQSMVGIFSFDIVPQYIGVTVAANLVFTGIGVFVLSKMFNSERVIFSK